MDIDEWMESERKMKSRKRRGCRGLAICYIIQRSRARLAPLQTSIAEHRRIRAWTAEGIMQLASVQHDSTQLMKVTHLCHGQGRDDVPLRDFRAWHVTE